MFPLGFHNGYHTIMFIIYCPGVPSRAGLCGYSVCNTVCSSGKLMHIRDYTECPRRNVPDFGRVFLMLKYTDITQNTYVQSWTVTDIMAREKCGLLAGPSTVPVSWQSYPCPFLSVVSYDGNSAHASSKLHMYFLQSDDVVSHVTSVLGIHVSCSAWNPKDNYAMSASVFVVQFNGFMSLTS